jgi:hypothetical protein
MLRVLPAFVAASALLTVSAGAALAQSRGGGHGPSFAGPPSLPPAASAPSLPPQASVPSTLPPPSAGLSLPPTAAAPALPPTAAADPPPLSSLPPGPPEGRPPEHAAAPEEPGAGLGAPKRFFGWQRSAERMSDEGLSHQRATLQDRGPQDDGGE